LIQPPVVATLGAVALGALDRIERHGLKLTAARGRPVAWHGRLLFPLFHPSPKVLAWFLYEQMAADFRTLRAVADAAIANPGDGGL
jgi:uracil-DNA glycosylase